MRDIAKEAENVILKIKDQNHGEISLKTNQIRKFLTAVNAITNKVNVYKAKHLDATELPDELAGEIQFLKVKAAYQAGKERENKKHKNITGRFGFLPVIFLCKLFQLSSACPHSF